MDTSLKASKKKDKSEGDSVKLTPTQQIALNCLFEIRGTHGTMQTVDGMRNKCVKTDQWKEEFRKIRGGDMLKSSFNSSWYLTRTALEKLGKVVTKDTWSWIVFNEVEAIDSPNSNVHPLKK